MLRSTSPEKIAYNCLRFMKDIIIFNKTKDKTNYCMMIIQFRIYIYIYYYILVISLIY